MLYYVPYPLTPNLWSLSLKRIVDILIGPTASGKSALALRAARLRPTVIINADAMQVYRELHVLTARPSPEEMEQAEHAMYGVWGAHIHGTAALWVHQAAEVVERVLAEGKRPLLVGGTGMYIRAMMEGLAPIPPVPARVNDEVRTLYAAKGTAGVREALAACDPVMAERLKPGDTQRNIRALEVFHATGKSLAEWQALEHETVLKDVEFRLYSLVPERAAVYAAIDARVREMVEAGGIEEATAVMALKLPAHLPALKAHGVLEFDGYARGEWDLETAIAMTQQRSRNYAKRQMTWIRQQCGDAREASALLADA